jgi:hypothetical protein
VGKRTAARVRGRLGSMPLRGPDRGYFSVAVPSTVPLELAVPIWIRRGWRASGLGIVTSSTPFSKDAPILSASTPSGSCSARENRPKDRSIR